MFSPLGLKLIRAPDPVCYQTVLNPSLPESCTLVAKEPARLQETVGLTGDGAGQPEEQGHLLEETLQEVLLLHGLLKTDHKSFVTLTRIYCHIHNSTPPF